MVKCPLKYRLQQFEGGEECDPECAWLVDLHVGEWCDNEPMKVCAVTLVGRDDFRKPVNPLEEE